MSLLFLGTSVVVERLPSKDFICRIAALTPKYITYLQHCP